MGRGKKTMALAMLCLLMILAGGCAPHVLMHDKPPWHQQDSGIYDTLAGKRFFGVGRASGIRNTTLLKATAGNAARKEMGRVLRRYITALVNEAAFRDGATAPSAEDLDQLGGLLVRNAVRRAVISDHWTPGPTRLLALCELDLETLKSLLIDDALPQSDVRQAMLLAADRVHTRLSGHLQTD